MIISFIHYTGDKHSAIAAHSVEAVLRGKDPRSGLEVATIVGKSGVHYFTKNPYKDILKLFDLFNSQKDRFDGS